MNTGDAVELSTPPPTVPTRSTCTRAGVSCTGGGGVGVDDADTVAVAVADLVCEPSGDADGSADFVAVAVDAIDGVAVGKPDAVDDDDTVCAAVEL